VRLGINYGFDRVRFVSPVPAGAEIMGRFTLAEIKPAADMVSLSWQVELALRDAAKPALAATWLVRLVTGDGTP
jgi:acyl dehydratase